MLLWVGLTEYAYCTYFVGRFGRANLPRYLSVGPFYLDIVDLANFLLLITVFMLLVARFARSRREQYGAEIELRRARSVQQLLVPEALPVVRAFVVEAAYLPAQEVSGDFFQVLRLQGKELMIVMGDVAGKGMAAALTVSVLVGAIKALVNQVDQPASLLAALNRVLAEQTMGFTTCLALRFSSNGHVSFACAGHPAPYLNGRELETEGNLPLGIPGREELEEASLQLCLGDRLLLITDGIPEAMNKKKVMFGWERTQELSCRPAQEIALAAQRYGQTDDITAVSVVFKGEL